MPAAAQEEEEEEEPAAAEAEFLSSVGVATPSPLLGEAGGTRTEEETEDKKDSMLAVNRSTTTTILGMLTVMVVRDYCVEAAPLAATVVGTVAARATSTTNKTNIMKNTIMMNKMVFFMVALPMATGSHTLPPASKWM